jgi:hypothetical protein
MRAIRTVLARAPRPAAASAAHRASTGRVCARHISTGRDAAEELDAKIRGLYPAAAVHEADIGRGAKQYSLRHPDVPDTWFAAVTFMQRPGERGMLSGATVHPALPFVAATKLVKDVVEAADQPPIAAAGLPGLCEWVRGLPERELQAEFGPELAEAVLAVAHGKPRPGHSVLGQGTFSAAEPAWVELAGRFANEPAAEEVRVYVAAGFSKDIKLQPMADTSLGGLASSGGTIALLRMAPK